MYRYTSISEHLAPAINSDAQAANEAQRAGVEQHLNEMGATHELVAMTSMSPGTPYHGVSMIHCFVWRPRTQG